MKYFAIVVFLLASMILLKAQSADTLTTKNLSEITIQENRIRVPVSESNRSLQLVKSEQLQSMPVRSLTEALQHVAGVDIRSRGPVGVQADLSIRGSSFDENLVLINGMKMTDPQTGHHLMNLPLSFQDIERVEVLKGAAARIYGQNAYAGAINIITKSATRKQINIETYGGFGLTDSQASDTSSFYDYGLSAAFQLPGQLYRQYLSLSRNASNGYQYNSAYSLNNVYYNSGLAVGRGELKLQSGLSWREFGANGFYSGYEEQEKINTGLFSLEYETRGNNTTLITRAYHRVNKDNYIYNRFNPQWFHNIHRTRTYGVESHVTHLSKWGISGIGLELRAESIAGIEKGRLATNALLENDKRFNAGVYLEHHFEYKKFSATPGMYMNLHSVYGPNAFPGIDMGVDLGKSFRLYGMVGRSYRVPTFFDLHYASSTQGIFGDPNLKSGYATTYETGMKYHKNYLKAELNGFVIDAVNTIDWVHDPMDTTAKWRARNFDNVLKYGSEVLLSLTPYKGGALQEITLSYTYIYSDLQNDQYKSRYALNNLRHQAFASGRYRIHGKFYHSFSMKYFSRPTFSDTDILAGSSVMDNYFLADTRVYWEDEGKTFYVEGTNLLNTRYVEVGEVQRPGFWVRMGLKWQFLAE